MLKLSSSAGLLNTWSQGFNEGGSLANAGNVGLLAPGATERVESALKSAAWNRAKLGSGRGNKGSSGENDGVLHFD